MTTDRDLAMLTGEAAPGLLASALGTAGGELVSWRVRDIDHRPGGSTTASYRAVVRWADEERTEMLGVTTSAVDPAAPGVLSLSDGERTVCVWRVPQDPGLPALAAATDPRALASVLRSFGIGDVGTRTRDMVEHVAELGARRGAHGSLPVASESTSGPPRRPSPVPGCARSRPHRRRARRAADRTTRHGGGSRGTRRARPRAHRRAHVSTAP